MKDIAPVHELVVSIRNKLSSCLTDEHIRNGLNVLEQNGFEYEDGLYPALTGTKKLPVHSISTPSNLAEALLWKQGDWNKYQRFVRNYFAESPSVPDDGVVHFAFAIHLRDNRKPIFDQHALRAMWAISDRLASTRMVDNLRGANLSKLKKNSRAYKNPEENPCKCYLMSPDGEWNENHPKGSSTESYLQFVEAISDLHKAHKLDRRQLDRFLMVLGSALKDLSIEMAGTKKKDQYQKFCELIGR